MEKWLCYGPDSLILDSDLQEISKRAHNITTVDVLLSFTHMPHKEELAMPLFEALQQILHNAYILPIPAPTPSADTTQPSKKT